MVNTIWKENFLIMCSKLCLNARDSGHFAQLLLICRNYSLQILCGAPHNVCNDEGKLIGLELNRGLRDEHGEIYDVMAGTFLVVGLSEDSFTSLTPEQVQKYTEHFKQPEQFISLNGQIIALPAEPENPLRTAEMTLEDDYGMIDGVLNNGRKGEELEKAQGEARRTTPEKKPSIRERLAEAKRECGERKPPDKTQQKKPPEHDL